MGTKLTVVEQMAIKGINARQQLLQQESLAIQEDHRAAMRAIEERLGLMPDAIGLTHNLDWGTWEIRELPREAMPQAIPGVTEADAEDVRKLEEANGRQGAEGQNLRPVPRRDREAQAQAD